MADKPILDIVAKKEITKGAKAAKPASPKKPFGFDDEINILTQEQIDVLNLPVSDIICIGAKGGGKSLKGSVRMLSYMETNYRANGLAFKKYKTNAAARLHDLFSNTAGKIKLKGFTIPDYEKGQSETYRMKNKMKTQNQKIEYLSFEDYASVAGISAYNNGFFPFVIFEEPVEMNDKNGVPDAEEFWNSIDAIKDSISRQNDDYMALYGVEVDTTKYYYTMNPWDDHPLIVYAESVFPEEDFLNYVKQDLFNNHTMVMVDQKLSRAIERTTKFANPVARIIDKTCYDLDIHTLADLEKKFDQIDIEHEIYKKLGIIKKHFENHLRKNNGTIYARAMNAMNSNNSFELAAILGLKFDGDGGNAKTYNTEKLETADTYALLKKSTEVSDLFMGWDIDHRRRLVLTPTVLAKMQLPSGKIIMNILTLPQVVIPTSGVGDAGERIDALSDQMIVAMESVMRAYKESTSHIRNFVGKIKVSIDDNFRHYISILNKKTMSIATDYVFFLAQKHGSWDIMHRQTWTNTAFDMNVIIIDQANTQLMSDLRKSFIAEGQTQRNEKGRFEKDYDFINSWEYALYFIRAIVHNVKPYEEFGTMEEW